MNAYGADAAAVVRYVGRPAVLVGTSLGGLASVAALADDTARAATVGIVLVDVLPDPDPPAVWAFLERSGLLPDAAPIAKDMFARRAELRKRLAEFDGPVLLIRGYDSPMTDDDVARFSKDCPRANVAVISSAGHLVARDQPVLLGRLLARTLPGWFEVSGWGDVHADEA